MEEQFHEFEFRALDNRPGRIIGPVVVYGDRAVGPKGRETMAPGFFENTSDKRIRVNVQHQRDKVLAANGRDLKLRDSETALIAETTLPKTTLGQDTAEDIRNGVLTGYSSQFIPRREEYRQAIRHLLSGIMSGLGVVDVPAYPQSQIELRWEDLIGEEFVWEERQQPLSGTIAYNTPVVNSDRGRQRKELVRPGAFDYVLNDPTREVLLTLGERADRPLASRLAGSLRLENTPEGLKFDVSGLPNTSYVKDFEELLSAGALAYGVRPLYRKPPQEAVGDQPVEEEIPDPDNDGVTINAVNQAVLTGLAIVPRAPRGNPGDIDQSIQKPPVENTEEQRRLLLRKKQELLRV